MELDQLPEAIAALEAARKLSPTDAAIEHDLKEAQQMLRGER
jgi:hypothetical protein